MSKPRIIISTDIGGSDPDDFESMVHAFLVADRFEIEGLISTPSKHGGRASDIHKVIDAYAQDYTNLKTWSSDYPTPEYLKSVVKQGSINVNTGGYGSPTEGSKHIIQKAHESTEPLWVLAWGSMTDVAQALHDDPSIASKIKVYSIGAWNTQQDPAARDYVYNNFKDLWWIENNTTFRGMYVNAEGKESNSWNMSDAKGHGALGDLFYEVRPWGIKMGDTPSLLRLIDPDTSNDSNPSAESWGGEFVRKTSHGPNYWTDSGDPAEKLGWYNGARTVYEDQAQIYKDMAKLFDRAKAPNPDAGDDGSSSGGSGGTGATDAVDDVRAVQPDTTYYVNARYFTSNDGGEGLRVIAVDAVSAAGVNVRFSDDGTVVYRPPSGWQGTDSVSYTVQAADGSTDTANVYFIVGHGNDPLPSTGGTAEPEPEPQPDPNAGTGNPVVAADNYYSLDPDGKLWFNARYLTWNDKGEDGGLKVTGISETTAYGVSISMASDGTIVYRAPSGWQGTDSLTYTVRDVDGSTDTATVFLKVGHGNDPLPETDPVPPVSSGETKSFAGALGPVTADLGSDLATHEARIMPVGDSHTYGMIASTNDRQSGGYRKYLAEKLGESGIDVDLVGRQENGPSTFDNDHEGYSGVTIDWIDARAPEMVAANKPDVILLLAGNNDAKTDSVETMKAEISQLIDTFGAYAPDAKLLVSGLMPALPDNTVGMDVGVIAEFNAALPGVVSAKAAAGADVTYVDTTSLTTADVSPLSVDAGVHLTHAGAEKLAAMWLDALKSLGTAGGTIAAHQEQLTGYQNLTGSSYDDVLRGDEAGNILNGGAGSDTLWGGSGADTFIFAKGASGSDVIPDFNPGEGDRVSTDYLVGEIAGWGTDTLTLQAGTNAAEGLHAAGHSWTQTDFLFG